VIVFIPGAPRVGKTALAQDLTETRGVPWLPTDFVWTLLRHVLAELDRLDSGFPDPGQLADYMYAFLVYAGPDM
jgi:chloramphenicol 3-O-phosphotransferase